MNILAIWVVGIVLTIRCAWEIGCLRIPKEKKTYGNPAGSPYKLDRSIPLYFLL